LLNLLGSANEPSPQEKGAFLNASQGWLLALKYSEDWYIEKGPSSAAQDVRQLLKEQPGSKIKELWTLLGGDAGSLPAELCPVFAE